MTDFDSLKKEFADAASAITDKATIEKVAVAISHIDELKQENEKLVKAHAELAADYKKAIFESAYKPLGTADEKGTPTPPAPTLESVAAQTLERLRKDNK